MPEYYTTQEAAEALGVCRQRVLQLRLEGKLVAHSHDEKGCKSKFFFKVEDVENLKLRRNDPEQVYMKPLAPVSVANKPRKKSQKK